MNYHIADFAIKIKNAALARRRTVVMPYSRAIKEIGAILVKEGFLKDIKEQVKDDKKVFVATLTYEKRVPAVSNVAIVSKPSLRIYTSAKQILKLRGSSLGIAILSTSQGYMTAKKAVKKGIGGEMLFRMW